tara:strand:+ start:287 stop:628 length:342 start_codon:yes stop_codon:yes gene_type:complete
LDDVVDGVSSALNDIFGNNGETASNTISKDEGGGSACFSGHALVETNDGLMKMQDVEVGTYVRTASGFEPVLSFLHKEDNVRSEFVELTTDSGVVPLTAKHLVLITITQIKIM